MCPFETSRMIFQPSKNVGRDSILARIHSMLQLWKIISRSPKACFWAQAQLVAGGYATRIAQYLITQAYVDFDKPIL